MYLPEALSAMFISLSGPPDSFQARRHTARRKKTSVFLSIPRKVTETSTG